VALEAGEHCAWQAGVQDHQAAAIAGPGLTAGACDGVLSEDWNLYVATHLGALGQPFTGGETVWAQGWFRDPPAPKTTNLSNALVFSTFP
jgi:hypothetical protein